jgi:nitrite reductase/ring-hydroxylating ferredoxin subunit
MPFIKVASLTALPPGTVTEVLVNGQPYAICNVDGVVRALNGVCIHRGGPLGQGQIHEGRLMCPFHLWEFDCATGAYDFDPTKRVDTYAVRVEGDDILIEAP